MTDGSIDQLNPNQRLPPRIAELWTGEIHWFSDWPVGAVPTQGSIVYTIWCRQSSFIYVGISGRTTSTASRSKGPLGRLMSHGSGRRSGDQFLIYVCDRLVLPRLGNRIAEIASGQLSLDRETRDYVRENLGFRWIPATGPQEAFEIERAMKAGKIGPSKPLLNPL